MNTQRGALNSASFNFGPRISSIHCAVDRSSKFCSTAKKAFSRCVRRLYPSDTIGVFHCMPQQRQMPRTTPRYHPIRISCGRCIRLAALSRARLSGLVGLDSSGEKTMHMHGRRSRWSVCCMAAAVAHSRWSVCEQGGRVQHKLERGVWSAVEVNIAKIFSFLSFFKSKTSVVHKLLASSELRRGTYDTEYGSVHTPLMPAFAASRLHAPPRPGPSIRHLVRSIS